MFCDDTSFIVDLFIGRAEIPTWNRQDVLDAASYRLNYISLFLTSTAKQHSTTARPKK